MQALKPFTNADPGIELGKNFLPKFRNLKVQISHSLMVRPDALFGDRLVRCAVDKSADGLIMLVDPEEDATDLSPALVHVHLYNELEEEVSHCQVRSKEAEILGSDSDQYWTVHRGDSVFNNFEALIVIQAHGKFVMELKRKVRRTFRQWVRGEPQRTESKFRQLSFDGQTMKINTTEWQPAPSAGTGGCE